MDNFYSGVELFVDLFIWECTLRELWGVSKNIFLLIQLIQNDQAFTEREQYFQMGSFLTLYYLEELWVMLLSNCRTAVGNDTGTWNISQAELLQAVQLLVLPCIIDYKKCMAGVDLQDQFCTCYTVKQKTRKWWKVIFSCCLVMAITNLWYWWTTRQIQLGWLRSNTNWIWLKPWWATSLVGNNLVHLP